MKRKMKTADGWILTIPWPGMFDQWGVYREKTSIFIWIFETILWSYFQWFHIFHKGKQAPSSLLKCRITLYMWELIKGTRICQCLANAVQGEVPILDKLCNGYYSAL